MAVNLTTDTERKTPKKWIKDTDVIAELGLDLGASKKGDRVKVKRFFTVQDKHFLNPFMATFEMISGEEVGKTRINNAFYLTNFSR